MATVSVYAADARDLFAIAKFLYYSLWLLIAQLVLVSFLFSFLSVCSVSDVAFCVLCSIAVLVVLVLLISVK